MISMDFWRKHRVDIAIALALFVLALVPRVVDLGMFLTADEKNWIGRSYEFVRAAKDWRFNDMLQTTHPGVTTLWASGLGVTAKILLDHVPFSFANLRHFVVAGQIPIALLNAILIPGIYWLLRRLFSNDRLIPGLAAAFMALNPFLVGYSRVVHVDALLAGFLFMAVLATLMYAKSGYNEKWLLISAALSALAILTKIPAVFIVPFLGLVVMVWEGKKFWRWSFLRKRLRDTAVWLFTVVFLIVLLWPALMWVPDQQGNVLLVKRDVGQAAITPHHMADDYEVAAWHYPATLLTRTTPVVFFLTLITLGWLVWQTRRRRQSGALAERDKIYWLLVAYIVFFVAMMTIGAKKGDRYILPVFPALDVLAAVGVVVAASWLKLFKQRGLRVDWGGKGCCKFVVGVVALSYLGLTLLYYHPYAIAYSSPLFPDNWSQELGWGEGLEQVGAWLSEHSPEAVVASWYPEELGAYTSAHVAHINAHEQGKVQYVVLYRNMFGRSADHYANDFIDEYYTKREPVFVAYVAGKEFAWVYEKPVYRGTTGELLPGEILTGSLGISHDRLIGIDVLLATYSGRATAGELAISLRSTQGQLVKTWRQPVQDIGDDQWLTLRLDESLAARGEDVVVEMAAIGTFSDNAPTVRSGAGGALAIRGRYLLQSGEEATDDHTKLLREE